MGITPTRELVGREEELLLADEAIRDAQRGKTVTLLIEGEAGIGKTRLVRALVDRARGTGMDVVRGEAHPLEATKPFGAIVTALDLRRASPDPDRAAIGRLLAGNVDRADTQSSNVADVRYRIVEDIVDLLEASCAHAPLVLVLEDLHWADESTLLTIRTIIRDLDDVQLLVVATVRPSPRSTELDQFLDDVVEMGARSIALRALAPREVDALVQAELGLPAGTTLAAVMAKAGGNPLWIVEILRSLSAEGKLTRGTDTVEVTTTALPDSLRELVVRQQRYLPQSTLDLLRIAAVLGDRVSVSDLSAVTNRSAAELVPELAEAFRAQLLGEDEDAVVFRHQLVHDAIYQAIPTPARLAIHREVASALARAGADTSQVASHYMVGARRGDLEAVRWLRDAARDAGARAPAVAVELLRCALRSLPAGSSEVDFVEAELVEALLRAGDVAEAADTAGRILERPHPREIDGRVQLLLLETLSLQNRGRELIDRAEAALKGKSSLSPADRALVLAQASYGRTFSGDYAGGEATARRALECAEQCGDLPMTVWSLGTLSVAVKTQGRYTEALALAGRAVDLAFDEPNIDARLRHPQFFLAMTQADNDLLDDARVSYMRAVQECHDLGSAFILPDALLLAAELRFLLGEWDDALAEIDAGLQIAAERGAKISVPQSRAYQAMIALARGDHRLAETVLAAVDAELESDVPNYGVEMAAFARALLLEAQGHGTAAYSLLLRFWQVDVQRENRYYHRYFGPLLVRLALLLEQRDVAHRVTEAVEAGAASSSPDVHSVQSAALRCRGLLDGDAERMVGAVETARLGVRVFDHGGACEDAASVLASVGRSGTAKELLTEALDLFENVGADAWAARATASLRGLGVTRGSRRSRRRPTVGWESLTPTERSVSDLVAEGLTNREVARRLHVSAHTVNTHLRHVFQKLSIASRAALAAEVTRRGAAAS